jgi:hypothetical protein
MTEYHVVPSGNMWRVQKRGGSVVSNHRKKAPAVAAARAETDAGDTIAIHRRDGTVQDWRSY